LLFYHQREIIKGPVIDMNNRFNKVFPSFNPLNKEFSSGSQLIDIFFSCFFFHLFDKCNDNKLEAHSHQLDNIAITFSLNQSHALIVTDTSIKNNRAISIAYIHVCDKPIIKTIYHVVNIILSKVKLFAIRYGISQAINIPEISKIFVITDSIYVVKRIFDLSIYLFQIYSASISKELRKFFLLNTNNSIEFWKCLS